MAEVSANIDSMEPLEAEANHGVEADGPADPGLLEEFPDQFRSENETHDILESVGSEVAENPDPNELFDAEQSEDLGDELDPDEALADQEAAAPEKATGAQARIRRLAAERKQLRDELGKQQEVQEHRMAQLQQQMEQRHQTSLEMQKQQNEMLQRQLELLNGKKEAEEEANLSPMEQYRRQLLRESKELAKQEIAPELNSLRQELEKERQMRAQALEEAQRRQRYDYYTRQTQQARDEVILSGIDPKVGNTMARELDDMILTYGASYGMQPKDAAPKVKQLLDRYVQAELNRRAKTSGKRVQATRKIPAPSVTQRQQVGSDTMKDIPIAQLKQNGFDDFVDWLGAGSPPLRPLKG